MEYIKEAREAYKEKTMKKAIRITRGYNIVDALKNLEHC